MDNKYIFGSEIAEMVIDFMGIHTNDEFAFVKNDMI